MTGKYNFTINQGATFSRVITWRDDANAPINLTSYTARMMIRAALTAPTPFITLTTENGGITLGGVAGTITLAISATDTAAIAENDGVYDLELVVGSSVTRLLEGAVCISKEVTR